MTGRRRSYLEHWASIHGMTVAEATEKFPQEAGIARYGEPEEIAELTAFLVSPGARWMRDRRCEWTGAKLSRFDGGGRNPGKRPSACFSRRIAAICAKRGQPWEK
jgi:NAD(P)-dependent dehydrogenase (short-subunit alcohol dehydrogenase family)